MTTKIEPQQNHRYPALDSLRGVAALSVVTFHLLIAMPNLPWHLFYRTPLVALMLGPEAVILFFVLSGFVLTLQLSKNATYFSYAAHRVCRIYIPYLAALFVSAICMYAVPHGAVPWVAKTFSLVRLWRKSADFLMIRPAIAFLLPSTKLMKFDPVFWSLVYEMRISLVFPLLLLSIRKFGILPVLLGGAALSAWVCTQVMPLFDDYLSNAVVVSTWLPTLHYMFLFTCGASIAIKRESIIDFLTDARLRLTIFATSVLLYLGYAFLTQSILHLRYGTLTHDWAITLAVCGIICCAIGPFEVAKFLEFPALRYLGKISYSLYLTHFILFLTIMHALGSHSTYLISAGLTGLLCVPAAHLTYYAVEAPSIQLARNVAKIIREIEGRQDARWFTGGSDTIA